jgi:hypothetical protein
MLPVMPIHSGLLGVMPTVGLNLPVNRPLGKPAHDPLATNSNWELTSSHRA